MTKTTPEQRAVLRDICRPLVGEYAMREIDLFNLRVPYILDDLETAEKELAELREMLQNLIGAYTMWVKG